MKHDAFVTQDIWNMQKRLFINIAGRIGSLEQVYPLYTGNKYKFIPLKLKRKLDFKMAKLVVIKQVQL